MKTDKILFIVNPVAGRMRSRTAMFDIVNAFCRQGHTVTTVVTQKRGHGSRLAAEAAAQGYDMIVCCGGDGTLNEVISGMMGSGDPLPLGYIPAG
ncbi:MAG: acylglycerol kinase family protein, partial [Firmicutes bacterium]|nr:acylglycerol kinase family protein [Bacillota bacterium]